MNAQMSTMSLAEDSTILETKNLIKYYDQRCILNNLNLKIRAGSIVGLVGRNGMGKSTLIRCLMGLMQYDEGHCSVFGESSYAINDGNKARIGYVPQQPEALGWLTIKQMFDFISGFYPNWDHDFVSNTIKRWGINTNRTLSTLSPGERQRIAVLRAMAYHPQLLVLDEPGAALDPVARRELLREIVTRSADDGTTIIFSTHIVSDLERIASDIIFLHNESILLQMPMDEIKERTIRMQLPAGVAEHNGRIPGELSRRRLEDNSFSIVLTRDENQDWPPLCYAPSIRTEVLGLEDLFIEVAQ
jgi:ABC-2 type transport system ATP-binding protein